jgi:hypothetical protein
MAIEMQVQEIKRLGQRNVLKGVAWDGTRVKQIKVTIPRKTVPTQADLQAGFDGGVDLGGAALWQEYQLSTEETNNRAVLAALFSAIDANASLQDVVTAGEAAMASNARQLALYTKLSAIHQAATPQTRYAFTALIAVLVHSEISKR